MTVKIFQSEYQKNDRSKFSEFLLRVTYENESKSFYLLAGTSLCSMTQAYCSSHLLFNVSQNKKNMKQHLSVTFLSVNEEGEEKGLCCSKIA